MLLFKKKITEEEAAFQFVSTKLEECKDFWPTTYATLKDTFGKKFRIEDENIGAFDLFLAKIALHLQNLKNMFPADQADRIRKWVLKFVDSPEYGGHTRNEIKEYEEAYNQSVRLRENPVNAIAVRLLHRWVGPNIADFDFEFAGKKTGTIGPLEGMLLTMVVTGGIGWKRIKDNFKLVDGGSRPS